MNFALQTKIRALRSLFVFGGIALIPSLATSDTPSIASFSPNTTALKSPRWSPPDAPGAARDFSAPNIGARALAGLDKDHDFEWKGRKYTLAEPPKGLRPGAAAAIEYWKAWATEHAYHMVLTKDQQVVLILTEKKNPKRALQLADKALARFDKILPVPTRRTEGTPSPNPERKNGGGLPGFSPDEVVAGTGANRDSEEDSGEDSKKGGEKAPPEPPAPPADPAPLDPDGAPIASAPLPWSTSGELGYDTAVVGQFRNAADYGSALDLLVPTFPYLEPWVAQGKQKVGCILPSPLFTGYLESAAGLEEWSLDNELVHRIAQVMVASRFGRQPAWVSLGVGWNIEFGLLKSIYSFPGRTGFVSVKEHGGWQPRIKGRFRKRKKDPMQMFELSDNTRKEYDVGRASLAWATIHALAATSPESLSQFLEELRVLRATAGKSYSDGQNWVIRADFDVSTEDQARSLKMEFGEDVFDDLTAAFIQRGG